MRPFTYNIYPLWLCLLLLLSACMQEDLQSVPNEGEGVLKLGSPTVIAELSSSTQTKATASLPEGISAPDASNFQIAIYDETGTKLVKENVNTTDSYVLPVGKYMVKVTPTTASNPELATTEAPAYFEGSTVVEIKPLQTTTASVTVYWGYSILNVTVDEELDFHLKDCSLEVTIGSETKSFSITNKKLGPLYVLGGRKTTVIFKGTNYVGSGESVSKVLLSENELPRATQYDITVNASTIEEFDIISSVTASHTYDNGTLTGTAVNLTIANDVPKELIEGWSATLSWEGITVRTYSSSTSLDGVSSVEMGGQENMIYIPQNATEGWDCKLSYSYVMNGQTYTGEKDVNLKVAAPDVHLTFAPYTSYTKYTEGNIEAANNCTNNVIYNLNASVNISNEVMSFLGGTLKYTYNGGEEETVSTNAISKGNVTVSSWQKYTAFASFSFDGVSDTINSELHITGLPYKAEPPKSSDKDVLNGWEKVGGKISWGNNYVDMYYSAASYPNIKSPTFNIPNDISVKIQPDIKKNDWGLNYNLSIYMNDKTSLYKNEIKKNETFNTELSTTMTSSRNIFYIEHQWAAAGPRIYVYKFNVYYKD